jgi:hypothetical protein
MNDYLVVDGPLYGKTVRNYPICMAIYIAANKPNSTNYENLFA